MVSPLDEFLTAHAVPVLRAAGFRRRQREFILDSPRGLLGAVGFYPNELPDSLGFFLQYGLVTPGFLSWREGLGVSTSEWASPSHALVMAQVFAPKWQRDYFHPYRWSLGDVGVNDQIANELRAALSDEVVANIRAWFDPAKLAQAAAEPTRPGRFVRISPRTRAPALALFEGGPSPELTNALANLPADDEVRIWIESQPAP